MIRFKTHISEQAAWTKDVKEYVFTQAIKLPVHPTLWKRVFNNQVDRDTVYHVFAARSGGVNRGIERLMKLQGKKKSISAFTEMDPQQLRGGVNVGGGIVAEMQADILIEYPEDIFSQPDRNGRRWIGLQHVDDTTYDQISAAVSDLRIELLKKHFNGFKDFPPNEREAKDAWKNIEDELSRDSMTAWQAGEISGDDRSKYANKKKSLLIADYIDGLERIMKKRALAIRNFLMQSGIQKYEETAWNELVVSNIDVKHLHILRDQRFYYAILDDYFPKEKTWADELETNPEVVKAINRQMMKLAKKYKFQYTYYDSLSEFSRQVGRARRANTPAFSRY